MTGKWIYAAGLALAVFLAYFAWRRFMVAPELEFSTIRVSTLEGESAGLDWLGNRRAIVCFAASWCAPCRRELADLNRIKSELEGIEIVVIGEKPDEKLRMFRDLGPFPFTFYRLQTPFSALGIHSIPTTYLVGSNGEVRKKVTGSIDWLDPSTREHLLRTLGP